MKECFRGTVSMMYVKAKKMFPTPNMYPVTSPTVGPGRVEYIILS